MLKKFLFAIICVSFALNLACQTATTPETNASNAAKADTKNLPPEFSTSPVPPSGNSTPGIPDPKTINANALPEKGATPIPGIPSQEELNKPVKKGATPTPGIPSEEEIKSGKYRRTVTLDEVNNPKNAPVKNGSERPRKAGQPTPEK